MKKKYSHEQISELTFNLLWMTANETEQFNSVLRIPIHNMDKTRDYFKIYRIKVQHIMMTPELAEAPDDYIIEYDLIDGLIKAGEDIDRILLWLKAINSSDNIIAQGYWASYFDLSVIGHYQDCENVKIQEFLQLYKTEVFEPYEHEHAKLNISDKRWMASPQNRSAYDEILWNTFYAEIGSSPGIDLIHYVYNILLRRFWRKNRYFLNEQEKEILYNNLVNFMQDIRFNYPENVDWEEVIPINDVMDVDNIPDFELYAAPIK